MYLAGVEPSLVRVVVAPVLHPDTLEPWTALWVQFRVRVNVDDVGCGFVVPLTGVSRSDANRVLVDPNWTPAEAALVVKVVEAVERDLYPANTPFDVPDAVGDFTGLVVTQDVPCVHVLIGDEECAYVRVTTEATVEYGGVKALVPGRCLPADLDPRTQLYVFDDGSFGLDPQYDERLEVRVPYAAYVSTTNKGVDGACTAFAEWNRRPLVMDTIHSLAVFHAQPLQDMEDSGVDEPVAVPGFELV